MKVRLTKDVVTTNGPMQAGEIIDHLMSHQLIRLGVAVEVTDDVKPQEDEATA